MIELMPDTTILYQWVMFILALLILTFGVFRPALKIVMARRSATEGDEAKAVEYEERIAELSRQIEASLDEARHAGHAVMSELRQEAEEVASETVRQSREKMESHLRDVRKALGKQSKEVELQLRQHSQALAGDLAKRVLGREAGKA